MKPTRRMQLQAVVATLDQEWNTAYLEGADYQQWLTQRLQGSFTITAGGFGETSYRWEGVTLSDAEQLQAAGMITRLYATGDMGEPDDPIPPETLVV